MNERLQNKFTLKIILSYLILGVLTLGSGYFIYTEINTYLSSETIENNDAKLLKTSAFLSQLYEAESLSKLALQNKTQENFDAYSQKIDSVFVVIDAITELTSNKNQRKLLDSVQVLLHKKVTNCNELRALKTKNYTSTSIDRAIQEFSKMEATLGKITAEGLAPNIKQLSPKAQKVIRDVAAYLNENVPIDYNNQTNSKQVDSIINVSKLLLSKAKQSDSKTQRLLAQKEMLIYRNDLELSQRLRTIISAFEQEVLVSSYNDSLKKKANLKQSIRLAGYTALFGLLLVSIFAFVINRDFWRVQTYREKLEEEKKFSESLLKSREQLISTVSHDLRSPLNTITGYAELMKGTALSEKQNRYLKHVNSSIGYITNLVNDLLDFSKLEGGNLKIENIPFIPEQLIHETSESIESIYTNKALKLYLDIDPILQQSVLGDPFRLRQILTNLIGNAFKFTEKGHIKVTAKAKIKKGKYLLLKIEVEDTGIGIAKERQDLIFNEFTQANTTIEKRFGGYGLGLTISKKLAELLNGKLTLKSALGKGSTFTVHIPLKTNSKLLLANSSDSYVAKKLKMLIIDDDMALLSMLGELTESMGITVNTFSNFSQVEKNVPLKYDLVLTDIQMPQITGFEVLKQLKSGDFSHYKNQPIIAMTGRKDLESKAYTSFGFKKVLQKPFSKKELFETLQFLGFEIKQTTITKAEDYTNAPISYSLEIIHSFLGNNQEAITEVLDTFLKDTQSNMFLLEEGINALDYSKVKQVAHRMLPMFRQLKVSSVIPTLEKLEIAKLENINKGQLLDALELLKQKIDAVTSEIKTNQLQV